MSNIYFSLFTTALGGKNFIAQYNQDSAIKGRQLLKSVEISVTGAVNVTIAPKHQRIDAITIMMNGKEQETHDPTHSLAYDFGDYEDLLDYFSATVVTFKDWDGEEKEVTFTGTVLQPIRLSPMKYPMLVTVQLMENT